MSLLNISSQHTNQQLLNRNRPEYSPFDVAESAAQTESKNDCYSDLKFVEDFCRADSHISPISNGNNATPPPQEQRALSVASPTASSNKRFVDSIIDDADINNTWLTSAAPEPMSLNQIPLPQPRALTPDMAAHVPHAWNILVHGAHSPSIMPPVGACFISHSGVHVHQPTTDGTHTKRPKRAMLVRNSCFTGRALLNHLNVLFSMAVPHFSGLLPGFAHPDALQQHVSHRTGIPLKSIASNVTPCSISVCAIRDITQRNEEQMSKLANNSWRLVEVEVVVNTMASPHSTGTLPAADLSIIFANLIAYFNFYALHYTRSAATAMGDEAEGVTPVEFKAWRF